MRKRTKAREYALQILYQMDITRDTPDLSLDDFWKNRDVAKEEEVKNFAKSIVYGVFGHKDEIDKAISEATENWHLSRMAIVDRNILRMATFELLFSPDIPPKVAINEAIDIAKKYGDQNSSKFVNGILDKINRTKRPEQQKG